MELCIEKMLVVSTAHLSGPYEIEVCGLLYYDLDHGGWLVYCGDDYERGRLNDGAKAVLEIARNRGCLWVKFDPDGPELEGIRTYDW